MDKKRKKKKSPKGQKLTSRQLQHEIIKLFRRNPKKQLNPKQVIAKLQIDNNKDSVRHALEKLADERQLTALEDYKYKLSSNSAFPSNDRNTLIGKVDMTRSGAAYIICEGLEEDVHVASRYMNTALHGDKVKVRTWLPPGRRKREGEIVDILERATEHYIGTYYRHNKFGIVLPDGRIPMDIKIESDELAAGATDGDKVVVKILKWTSGRYRVPLGQVTTVLGKAGSNDIEMKSILINNGFNLEFPDKVLAEAEALPSEIPDAEVAVRRDMRHITTFTIDPDTAKDFDDALSIEFLEDGQCEVGVHIADVSYYVREGSELDKEGFQRSTSVYLVDRVLPMLPEKLSNELCSLRPHEDKLTFSAVFTFNKDGKVLKRWFGKTLIHSDHRFTYEEAQEVLDSGEGPFAGELQLLNRFALALRKERFRKGAIGFETEEVKFRLDEEGVPVEVFVKERKAAHMLIEDFMLLANKEVALFIDKKSAAEGEVIPFIYRIHDEPDPDRVFEFARFAREMGFDMDVSSPERIAQSYNRLVKAAETNPGLKILEPIAIRTMAKAAYSSQNIGHYGLGFSHYSHFTSPIRRYSDVLAHRLLEQNLAATFRTNPVRLEEQCKHISQMERKAMDAERESVKYKQVEFIEKHIDDVFTGVITGMIDRGFFVELKENKCEGMVGFDTMDEPFDLHESRLRIIGRRSGKIYKMGDEVLVKVVDADLSRRRIDLAWVKEAPADVEYFE